MPRTRRSLARHVVLVSVDGLRPEYYLDERWPAPAMRQLFFERYRPMLSLVHCEGAVQIQQEPDWRNPRRLRALAAADLVVSLVLEIVERDDAWDNTAIVVTGDHGMMEVHTQLRPNIERTRSSGR